MPSSQVPRVKAWVASRVSRVGKVMLGVSFGAHHPQTMVFHLPGGAVACEPHGLLCAVVRVPELVPKEHPLQNFGPDGSVIMSVKQYLQGKV